MTQDADASHLHMPAIEMESQSLPLSHGVVTESTKNLPNPVPTADPGQRHSSCGGTRRAAVRRAKLLTLTDWPVQRPERILPILAMHFIPLT